MIPFYSEKRRRIIYGRKSYAEMELLAKKPWQDELEIIYSRKSYDEIEKSFKRRVDIAKTYLCKEK